jgi:hypothetical protein
MVPSTKHENESKSASARPKRPVSGVYAMPLAVAASYRTAVAHDDFTGLDRLDRDELDETDDDVVTADVRVILPRALRRIA